MFTYKFHKDNPCSNDCPDRRLGCHGHCAKEAEYKKAREEIETKAREAKNKEWINDSYKAEKRHKARKRRK